MVCIEENTVSKNKDKQLSTRLWLNDNGLLSCHHGFKRSLEAAACILYCVLEYLHDIVHRLNLGVAVKAVDVSLHCIVVHGITSR